MNIHDVFSAVTVDSTPAPPLSKEALHTDALTWSNKVTQLVIRDAESCRHAGEFLKSIKGLRAQIQRWFAPHVEAAMETKRTAEAARKALVEEQARIEAPLIDAESRVKRDLLAFEQQQEQARRAEEARLQADAQRAAEAATLATAAELERVANTTGDAAMLEEAQEILAQPIEAAAVHVESLVPKVQGVTYRDNWKAHPDIDVRALAGGVAAGRVPAAFLIPNVTAINQMARATKGTAEVPGVRFYNDRQIAAKA